MGGGCRFEPFPLDTKQTGFSTSSGDGLTIGSRHRACNSTTLAAEDAGIVPG